MKRRSWNLVLCLTVWALLAGLGTSAESANVRCVWTAPGVTPCTQAVIAGTIEKGDYEKVVSFFTQNDGWTASYYLVSGGGDVDEAFRIGRFFRHYLVTVEAPVMTPQGGFLYGNMLKGFVCQGADCSCASACALIWFGAVARFGEVGLHRPVYAGDVFASFPPGAAQDAYKPLLKLIADYLAEMEAPAEAIEAMIGTSSSEIKWFSAPEPNPPSFAEWLEANCARYCTSKERRTLQSIEIKISKARFLPEQSYLVSDYELKLAEQLTPKVKNRSLCEVSIASKRRRELLPQP